MLRIKNFLKSHRLLFILLGLLVIIYHAWFFNFGIRTHGDWSFLYKETAVTLRQHYFSLWLSDYSFGRVLIDVGQAPTYALYGILAHYFGASYAVSERIIHLWPAVLVSPIAAYFLTLEILKDKRAAIVGAIVYSSNTYLLILQTGHLTLAGSYAVTPFVILFFIKLLDTYKLKYAIYTALSLTVCSAYEPRAAYIVMAILFMYAAFRLFVIFKKHTAKKELFRLCFFAGLPILLYILMNLYWIIGLASIKNAFGDSILARSLFGSAFFSLLSAFTLFHPYWNFSKPIPFIVNMIPFYFWLIPVLAFAGLYVRRRNFKIMFFGLLALVGVLLSKQADSPFTELYGWLYGHIPGFSAFREASKFYFISTLAYAVLIAAFCKYLITKRFAKLSNKIIVPLVVGFIALLFLPNLYPIATGKIGTTFATKTIPSDYTIFRDFILRQPDFFRIYWTPRDSRWSVQTALHPRIDSPTINETAWKDFIDPELQQSRPDALIEPLKKAYSDGLLDQSSVKYVVVPLRDLANDDDFFVHYGHDRQEYLNELDGLSFLKRINIGTKDLAVYENTGYKPYISATNLITTIPSPDKLESAYVFQKNQLGDDSMNFVTKGLPDDIPQRHISDLFGNLTRQSIINKTLQSSNEPASSQLYANTDEPTITYQVKNRAVSFYSKAGDDLTNDNKPVLKSTYDVRLLNQTLLNSENDYIVKSGNTVSVIDAKNTETQSLGNDSNKIELYKLNQNNLIPNHSLENGTWQQKVKDCNAFDSNAGITMSSSKDQYTDGRHSLKLSALNHTACTGPDVISITPQAQYYLRFDYKVIAGRQASYEIRFNDKRQTIIRADLINTNERWNTMRRSIEVPAGATSLTLLVKASPDDKNLTTPIVYYDNFRLSQLNLEQIIRANQQEQFTNIGENQQQNFRYTQSGFLYNNKISNPSFEQGLWQQKVGDCNAYDKKPVLGMRLDDKIKTDGNNSLVLEAERHIACTGPGPIKVIGDSNYLLSFDYRGKNAESAGLNLSFNDGSQTVINERLPIKNNDWNQFDKVIKIPPGATNVQLLVYAYADSSDKKVVNYYDNFSLKEVPSVSNRFYTVTSPSQSLIVPKKITYTHINPTSRKILVEKATTPFFLTMSESYHPQWQLELSDSARAGALLANSQSTIIDNSNHFKLNNFMNAWYVDPVKICKQAKSGCQKNTDGSYSLNMIVEFTPQRSFNLGLLISTATLIGCIGFVAYQPVMKKFHKDPKVWKVKR